MAKIAPPNENQPLARKCDEFDLRLQYIKEELIKIHKEWQEMDMDALDAEEHDFWASDVANDFIDNIETAVDFLDDTVEKNYYS